MTDLLPIRPAGAADRTGIEALCNRAFDEADAAGVPILMDDARFGPEAFWVAEDDGHVVSCLGLLTMTLDVGGVQLPLGQPEYIATDEGHRGRGLVRRMMHEAHERSAGRGDLLQIIGGIPYYYRRFGYGWGIGMPGGWRLRSNALPEAGEGVNVRTLTVDDLGAIEPLYEMLSRRADVFNLRTHEEWRAMLAGQSDETEMLAVERDGAVTAYGRCDASGKGARLADIAATTVDDVTALARYGLDKGAGDLNIIDRPRTAVEAWGRSMGVRATDEIWAWYIRIADPVALLDALRPALTARLADGPFEAYSGQVPFTTYVSGFALTIENGTVTGVEQHPAVLDPGSDTVGVAPDLLPGLIFGRRGASVEQDLHPDVLLGRHAALVDALFPKQDAHISLWF